MSVNILSMAGTALLLWVGLRVEARVLCLLGLSPTTELHPSLIECPVYSHKMSLFFSTTLSQGHNHSIATQVGWKERKK